MGPSTRSVLVLNAGSSSLKYALYNLGQNFVLAMQGIVEQIGTPRGSFTHKALLEGAVVSEKQEFKDHKQAMEKVLHLMGLDSDPSAVVAVGHRVVHGGESVSAPCIIDDAVKGIIEKAIPLAPLHNPPNLLGINVAQQLLHCPQVAVFDTAFHATMPPHAFTYGIPYSLYKELGIRRYGFHGTSYAYLLQEAARFLNKPEKDVNMIAFHLGAGASVAAVKQKAARFLKKPEKDVKMIAFNLGAGASVAGVKQGRCIDTSMGVTPLEGLVMATRSGDIDPAIGKILSDLKDMSPKEVDNMLNKESGLFGICGEKDMRSIIERAAEGDEIHKLALDVFVHRVRRYLGAYFVNLNGEVDAIVFSAGIGERSAPVREMVCRGLGKMGIVLDEGKNAENRKDSRDVSADGSPIRILVLPTDEELRIAQETMHIVSSS